jgi:4-hydroxy-tetrahydrodipicolinate synthase
MIEQEIVGVMTALVTPFRDNCQIDWESFDRLLEQQSLAQVDGLIICGTTGEAPTLSVQEKLSLIRRARANTKASIQIIAGTGGNDTAQSIELSRLAEDAGANGLLIVTPPYNKPSLSGLKLHFEMIANATSIPLILYHVPGRTGQRLSAQEMAEISEIPRVSSIKEASGDLALFSQTHALTKATLLSGDDITYLPSLAVGGRGVISVLTNVFPEAFIAMTQAFQSGQLHRALKFHETLLPMINILFCESNPGPVKAALSLMGHCQNYLRAPLAPVSEENLMKIRKLYYETKQALEALEK